MGLMVAVLWVHAVAIVVVAAIVVATSAGAVAHALLWSIVIGIWTAVAVIAVATLRVAVGFVA